MTPIVPVRRLPWSIPAVALGLVLLGCIAIARCDDLSAVASRVVRQQIVFSGVALATLTGACIPNYRVLCRLSPALFAFSLVLLAAVYCFPPINDAHRWIRVGPVGLQPSELAKVAYVLALARYLMYRENHRRFRGLLVPVAVTVLPVLLILKEPNLGTAAVFLPVMFVMLFAAGARRVDLARVGLVGVMLLPLLWTQMNREQRSRVTAFFEQPAPPARPSDDAYHLHQAKRMMALGGVWGSCITGPLTDDTAAYHLPEARSDFILCVLVERLGLPGLVLVLGLFGVLVWRGLAVAAATREPFGRLVAIGLSALIAVEVLIHAGMSVGLLPIAGLSLPLVSYGGSGLLANGIALGLLMNIGMRPGYEVTKEPFRYVVE